LPIFTLRTALSRFEVTIGAPIAVPEGADGEPEYAAAIRTYAEMLEPFVLSDPGQWRSWATTKARAQPTKDNKSRRTPPSAGPAVKDATEARARQVQLIAARNKSK